MTPTLDPFAPGSAALLVLVAVRLTGLLLIAPTFSASAVPRQLRVALLVVFTGLLQPVARVTATAPLLTPATLAAELLVGFAIGLGAALVVGAAEMAGDVMAVQIGLSGSALLDPLDQSQLPSLGIFTRLFAIALLLTFDLHQVLLGAIADSFVLVPPGQPVAMGTGLGQLVALAGGLFVQGLRFAAPVMAVLLLINAVLAILTRAAPQFNLLTVAFPLQIAVGLFAFATALPAMAYAIGAWSDGHALLLDRVLETLVAPAPVTP
jgi:flagellar biosynthetic protein FliR